MAEFTEVMRQAKRMCNDIGDCDECPLCDVFATIDCPVAHDNIYMNPVEKIVMDWAAAHPEPRYPTWEEWQKANFPTAHSVLHPCSFMGREEAEKVIGIECGKHSCNDCTRMPIPTDIAEKLGIKPIGVDAG